MYKYKENSTYKQHQLKLNPKAFAQTEEKFTCSGGNLSKRQNVLAG